MRRLPISPSHSRNTSLTSTIVTSRYAIAPSPQLREDGSGGCGRHVSGPGGMLLNNRGSVGGILLIKSGARGSLASDHRHFEADAFPPQEARSRPNPGKPRQLWKRRG